MRSARRTGATTQPHAAIVYHPTKTPLDRLRNAVERQERDLRWGPSRWYQTRAHDSGSTAAEQALASNPAVIIVAGGDGTIRALADAVHGSGIPTALIPTGTGNLLARDLGIALGNMESNIATAFTGSTRAIDIGVAEFDDSKGASQSHVFVAMAGIGLDAEMAEHTSAIAKKHLGWFAYVTPIARSIILNKLFHIDYRIDRSSIRSTRAHTVIVGNCGTLTGNMLLIPRAVIDDGLLDVVMMRPKGRLGWARIGTRLTLQGIARRSKFSRRILKRAPDIHALSYVQGREFEAQFDTPHTLELDGDSFGYVTRVNVSIRPAALHVRVPRKFD